MKKVLFIGMTPNQGGMETFMLNTFMKLEGKEFHFEFINTSNEKIAYSNLISKNNGVIRNVRINDKWITHIFRYSIAYNFFKKHHDYDIVHLNTLSINLIFWLKAAKKFNIKKLIIHSHNNQIHYSSKLRRYFGSLLAINNSRYLNNSDITELSASKSAGEWMFNNNDFKVINNGINTKKFLFNKYKKQYLKDKLSINNNKIFITVARMDYQKNYEKIINVFKIINIKMSNTKLIIVGDGPEYNNVINLVKKLGLINDVIFTGMITNVNEILNIADLMLMPSRYEGFPFALIESQASGVPALVSSEAIPKASNVTNTLKYLSLQETNNVWANTAINMLRNFYDNKFKFKMNGIIKNSKYSINESIKQIKVVYSK